MSILRQICYCGILLIFFLNAHRSRAQTTFQRSLDSLNGIFCLEQSNNGHFWLGSFLGKIIHLDANGQWIGAWTPAKGDTASARFIYDLEKTPDGGVWALFDRSNQNTALDDHLILARLSANGTPLWQRTVHYGEVQHWAHNRLTSDPAGNVYALSARFSAPGSGQPSRLILVKTAPDGSILWRKSFYNQALNFTRVFRRLADGSLLICGNGQLADAFGFILRLSPDGDILWSRRFQQYLFKEMIELPDGDWLLAATQAGSLPQRTTLLRMHPDGSIAWAKQPESKYPLNWIPGLCLDASGNAVVFNYETLKTEPFPDIFAINPDDGALRWAKAYDRCHSYGASAGLLCQDGGLAAIRFRPGGHLLLKTDEEGNCQACQPETAGIVFKNAAPDFPLPFEWESATLGLPLQVESDFRPFFTNIQDYCGQLEPVSGFNLSNDMPCAGEAIQVAAYGQLPADLYQWQFPGAQGAGTQNTASIGGIRYSAAGMRSIRLVVSTGFCRDTFEQQLEVLAAPAAFDLGPNDTLICGNGKTLTLDATASNATHWRWNDGLENPIRTVNSSGTYAVQVFNNNCERRDTITVRFAEGLNLNLPPDTLICGADTLWLDASTPDAERYTWNDGETNARRAITKAGFYAVTAFNGTCSSSDFIAVDLLPTPEQLPADTLLCEGEKLELRVGASVAADIRWNGQPGLASFEVEGSGMVKRELFYRGCYFADSIRVSRVPCKDGFNVYVPNVFAPDKGGENAVFKILGNDLEIRQLQIYDRWGNLQFEQQGSAITGWDGKNMHSKAVPPGVYLWLARVRQRARESVLSGDILLIR